MIESTIRLTPRFIVQAYPLRFAFGVWSGACDWISLSPRVDQVSDHISGRPPLAPMPPNNLNVTYRISASV